MKGWIFHLSCSTSGRGGAKIFFDPNWFDTADIIREFGSMLPMSKVWKDDKFGRAAVNLTHLGKYYRNRSKQHWGAAKFSGGKVDNLFFFCFLFFVFPRSVWQFSREIADDANLGLDGREKKWEENNRFWSRELWAPALTGPHWASLGLRALR